MMKREGEGPKHKNAPNMAHSCVLAAKGGHKSSACIWLKVGGQGAAGWGLLLK